LLFLGGLAMLSSSASATEMSCQAVLGGGSGLFSQLEGGADSCDVGNVTFSNFSTTLTAADVTVEVNGFTTSPVGSILGFTYGYLNGVFPVGTIGYTATYDPNAATDGAGGLACPVTDSVCGITGVEVQLNSILGNGAVVTTTYSGGFVGTSQVDSATLADETYQATIPIVEYPTSLTKVASYNGSGSINNFSTEVITGGVSNTPEPATLGLVGGTLLGLGLLRRKKSSRSAKLS
jgi:hypothetical protein